MDFIGLKSQYAAMRDTINARIQMVLDHGQYILGPEVRELEDRFAAYTGAMHCITVASGTEALLISLMALGVRPGDESLHESECGDLRSGSTARRVFGEVMHASA